MRLYWAWILVLMGTLGSLYASEMMGFEPCNLCWYQRICLYPLSIMLPIAIWRDESAIIKYIIAFPIIGMAIAACQIVVQFAPPGSHLPICGSGRDCQTPSFQLFGWLTMPMLSLANFALVTCLISFSPKRRK